MGKRKRILTVIFPSNYPNFAADSIFTFNRILFSALLRTRDDFEVFAAGPTDMPPLAEGVTHVPLETVVNKFQVRFSFPWAELRRLIGDVRPDICLVNMPEQAAALSILIKDELKLDCKIVTYVHYIPAVLDPTRPDAEVEYEPTMNQNGHGPVILLRLLEGVLASDLALICSRFGIRLLRELAGRLLGNDAVLPPVAPLPPPVDFGEVDGALAGQDPEAEPRFVYNHRLYNEYGTRQVFDLLTRIVERGTRPFQVLVTNPTAGRSAERSRLNPQLDENLERLRQLPFVQLQHFSDRSCYIRALGTSWAGIAPYKPHALWSMSVMDVLACGRPVLSFDIAAFREMGLRDEFLVQSEGDFETAFRRLLDERPDERRRQEFRAIASEFSGLNTSRRFLQLAGVA